MTRGCSTVAGQKNLATANCMTTTTRWSGSCVWSDAPCEFGPYFKPGRTYNGPPAGFTPVVL